jgi:tetratricopeptide (TPR) repeat protein
MKLNLNLQKLPVRLLFLGLVLAFCGWLVMLVVSHFITGTLTDERIAVERERLAASLASYPDSARLNARYAQAEMLNINRNLEKLILHAQRAVNLSPYNYRYRLTLASALEMKGDRAAAEKSLERAIQLAPANPETHWQMANVRLRQGKLAEALPEFKLAASSRRNFLPATLDLIWRVSGGKSEALEAVTGDDTPSRVALANFLIRQSRPNEAVKIFSRIDREERLALPESGGLISSFMEKGSLAMARELWLNLVSSGPEAQSPLVWNGGFEADLVKNFNQFDWNFARSDYATLSVDPGVGHSGSRSLKIDFVGKDTARLDNEIRQTILLEPGQKYRLECFVRTDKFSTPKGPQVVLVEAKTHVVVASSTPVAAGTSDWQRLSFDFVAPPQSANGLNLLVRRIPEFSYDEPTRGAVWFDDFKITKL